MQLSKKQKTFSEYFTLLLKAPSNFEHFERNDDTHSLSICEIRDCQRRG